MYSGAKRSHLTGMLPLPESPAVENLISSLVTEMQTLSPMVARSLLRRVKCIVSPYRRA